MMGGLESGQLFNVTAQTADDRVVLVLEGELDLASVERLKSELETVEGNAPGLIVFDLRKLSFLDSTGLGVIVAANTRAAEKGGRVVIAQGDHAPVRRLFEVVRLDESVEIVDDPSDV